MRYTYPDFLDFTLEKRGIDSVYFEIHSQAKKITTTNYDDGPEIAFDASSEFRIESSANVELSRSVVFLRGSDDFDSGSGPTADERTTFKNEAERDVYHDEALQALVEFAEHHGAYRIGYLPEPEQLTLWD